MFFEFPNGFSLMSLMFPVSGKIVHYIAVNYWKKMSDKRYLNRTLVQENIWKYNIDVPNYYLTGS